jgi:hypothetical protein
MPSCSSRRYQPLTRGSLKIDASTGWKTVSSFGTPFAKANSSRRLSLSVCYHPPSPQLDVYISQRISFSIHEQVRHSPAKDRERNQGEQVHDQLWFAREQRRGFLQVCVSPKDCLREHVFLTCFLLSDIQNKFKEILVTFSPEKRAFYGYMTSVVVRLF